MIVLKIVCLFWLIAKVISIDTWLADRLLPVVPLFDILQIVPIVAHAILFYTSCICIVALLLFNISRLIVTILFFLGISSCLLDVTRWQPWEYQYLFILVAYLLCKNNTKAFYTSLLFILSSIYIFSGLHKLNGGFLRTVWESMLLHNFLGLSFKTIKSAHLHYGGALLAIIETICGLALLFAKNKKWPVTLAIFFDTSPDNSPRRLAVRLMSPRFVVFFYMSGDHVPTPY